LHEITGTLTCHVNKNIICLSQCYLWGTLSKMNELEKKAIA